MRQPLEQLQGLHGPLSGGNGPPMPALPMSAMSLSEVEQGLNQVCVSEHSVKNAPSSNTSMSASATNTSAAAAKNCDANTTNTKTADTGRTSSSANGNTAASAPGTRGRGAAGGGSAKTVLAGAGGGGGTAVAVNGPRLVSEREKQLRQVRRCGR